MEKIRDEVAVGTKIFMRVGKLEGLLTSIPEWVTAVYIADDGEESEAKASLFSQQWPFDLEIIDLEYDVGVGIGRNALVEAVDERYLLLVDPDHRIPPTAPLLYHQLDACPELGGIGGLLVEPDNNRLYSQAADFREENTSEGTKLVRDTYSGSAAREIEIVHGAPLVKFDFIPHATLFKRECLEQQRWDPKYITEFEHTDFFLSHWKQTKWEFAVSPSVQFLHFPGGSTEYMLNRKDTEKSSKGERYFLKKWDYVGMETTKGRWIEAGSLGSPQKLLASASEILREEGPIALLRQTRQYLRNRL